MNGRLNGRRRTDVLMFWWREEADILSLLCSTCGAISRLVIALAGNPELIFSRHTKTPEMTVGLMMTPWPTMHPTWLPSHMLLASLVTPHCSRTLITTVEITGNPFRTLMPASGCVRKSPCRTGSAGWHTSLRGNPQGLPWPVGVFCFCF